MPPITQPAHFWNRLTNKFIVTLIQQSGEFDTAYYLSQNPDVAAQNTDPVWHYLLHGAREHRCPNASFDRGAYLKQHPDLYLTGIDPFIHAVVFSSSNQSGHRSEPPDLPPSAILRSPSPISALKMRAMQSLVQLRWQTDQKKEALQGLVKGRPPKSHDPKYQLWLAANFPVKPDLQRRRKAVKGLAYQPTISIIMPTYNTPERFLRQAIDSVLAQVYPRWELCIADDASPAPQIKSRLKKLAKKDRRIKVTFRSENGHIPQASNSALALATGEFIALLDHDDLLTPDALYEIASLLNSHPEADIIYSDEDKIDDFNYLQEPFFKPDWSPDSLLSRMYISHLGVYRRSLVEANGGFRIGLEGAQDYDLALRLTEQTKHIFHIPKVLYHWRIHAGSTSASSATKSYAHLAAKRAVEEALQRRQEPGQVNSIEAGHLIVRYQVKTQDRVSVIIPTRDLADVLDVCLTSIFTQTIYPNFEVLVIDNGSVEPPTFNLFEKWRVKEPERFSVLPLDIPFNYSKLNNYGVEQASGQYLLFLNNDTEVITPDWLTAMVEQAQRPTIGAVGALLLYPDDTVQHAGVIAGIGGVAGHSHKYADKTDDGYFNQLQTVNNYSAVTGACLMCRRDVFEAVGGFEEQLTVAFNDVDLCFKILNQGYYNVYLPHVQLYHYESKSRGLEDNPEKQARFTQEIKFMQTRWAKLLQHDPFYNPNLTLTTEDYDLKRPDLAHSDDGELDV